MSSPTLPQGARRYRGGTQLKSQRPLSPIPPISPRYYLPIHYLSRLGATYLSTTSPRRYHVHRVVQLHVSPLPSPQPGRPYGWSPTHLTKVTVVTSCVAAQLVEGGGQHHHHVASRPSVPQPASLYAPVTIHPQRHSQPHCTAGVPSRSTSQPRPQPCSCAQHWQCVASQLRLRGRRCCAP